MASRIEFTVRKGRLFHSDANWELFANDLLVLRITEDSRKCSIHGSR